MAQYTLHLVLAKLLVQKANIKNENRFALGHILPDAVLDRENRDKSHYIISLDNGKSKAYDFQQFGVTYKEKILNDELYLGYYMHLVEDALYRKLLYRDYGLRDVGRCPEKVAVLHNDYHLINRYVVEKHRLKNELIIPGNFDKEEIHGIADFGSLESYLQEREQDFHEKLVGTTVYFTEKMADEYIEKYLGQCVEEMKAIGNSEEFLKTKDYKWEA